MSNSVLVPFVNPAAREWSAPEPVTSARAFHETLDGYRMSPLVELPTLATELGVGRVFLKDESERLGLPAFKILGASWAVAKSVARRFGVCPDAASPDAVSPDSLPPNTLSLGALREAIGDTPLTLVTATDGNHGRAVSHMARLLGMSARVYTPAGVSAAALEGIRSEGAELVELAEPYDFVVHTAAASVEGNDAELLIQDTSWPGYADVPGWIVEGYTTLLSEVDEQLSAVDIAPDAVFVPTGVGSLLQAVIEYYRGTSESRPAIVCVEPVTAACVLKSLHAGELRSVDTSAGTIMTGMCTGSVSELAWPALRAGLDAAVVVDDALVRAVVGELGGLGLEVGPCGAATLAGLRVVDREDGLRDSIGLGSDSVVVLLSTEGLAANPLT